jgi:hypothetical protein
LFNEEEKYKNTVHFKQFFKEHDSRRGTDFKLAFPELKNWYENIK